MTKKVDVVIVIPVAPSTDITYLKDTIDSVVYYTKSPHVIIIVEDLGTEIESKLLTDYSFLKILKNPTSSGGVKGGLYINLSHAFKFAFDNYEFKVLLKLDTDALVIGESPEKDAISHFKKYPNLGELGSYKFDCNGEKRDYTNTKNILKRETSLKIIVHNLNPKKVYQNLKLYIVLHNILKKSMENGYECGEHCLGGAHFISHRCIQRLIEQKLLPREEFRISALSEDHIFGLLIRSTGFEIGDFATGNLPIGVRHLGLPCSPSELIKKEKKLTHSTRFWNNLNEDDIRDYFKKQREN